MEDSHKNENMNNSLEKGICAYFFLCVQGREK